MQPREFQDGQWVQFIGSLRQGDIGVIRRKAWGEEQYDVALMGDSEVRVPGSDLAAIEKQEPLNVPETPANAMLPA